MFLVLVMVVVLVIMLAVVTSSKWRWIHGSHGNDDGDHNGHGGYGKGCAGDGTDYGVKRRAQISVNTNHGSCCDLQ